MTIPRSHLGEKPEPLQGDRKSLPEHMSVLDCPVAKCKWHEVAGSHEGGLLLFSLHWREAQESERRRVSALEPPYSDDEDEESYDFASLRRDLNEVADLLTSDRSGEALRKLERIINDDLPE